MFTNPRYFYNITTDKTERTVQLKRLLYKNSLSMKAKQYALFLNLVYDAFVRDLIVVLQSNMDLVAFSHRGPPF